MNLKDRLLGSIFESTPHEETPKVDPVPTAKVTPITVSGAKFQAQPILVVSDTDGDPTKKGEFLDKLQSKLAVSPFNNVLQQFQGTMESLADSIPEEGNRFRAALKLMQKTSGIDSSKLIEGYNSLLTILDGEVTKFSGILADKTTREVGSREQQIETTNKQIESKQLEIQQLMTQRDDLVTAVSEQKMKLGATQASFDGAVASVRNTVMDALNRLNIYVPKATTAK